MVTKPTQFTVVPGNKVEPPRKLGVFGSALWNSVQSEYRIDDIGGIELLAQACTALDRAEELAEVIAHDGPVVRTKFTMRAHPCIKEELALRAFIVRTLERLGLNVETLKSPGRPTRPTSWTPDAR